MEDRLVLGGFEKVYLPDVGVSVRAKVDTGAFSGALHCSDIKVDTTGDKAVLNFTPLDTETTLSTKEFKRILVRSAHGHEQVRYIAPIKLELHGRTYKTLVGLTDRTIMKHDMLLGRRFLIENNAIVDPSRTKAIDDEAERIV